MAPTSRNIPANYPQPLGIQILKADAHRQASILRQEIVTDLLTVLTDVREPASRNRLIKLVEGYLHSGVAAARKAEEQWPALDVAKQAIAAQTGIKPALATKHLKLFEQLDRAQHRSLDLLEESFENIRLILERLRGPEKAPPASGAPAHPRPGPKPNGGGK